jgi:5-methylthioadenosine/S-adenosylhomocysteine deaminase
LGWDASLGTLESGKLADFIVVEDMQADVYQNLILSKEENINLVVVNGIPRYGSTALMDALPGDPINPAESITVNGASKKLYLFSTGSEINDVTFTGAQSDLTTIMSDLAAFVKRMGQQMEMANLGFDVIRPDNFKIVLDNEYPAKEHLNRRNDDEEFTAGLVKPDMQNSIDLDGPFASGDNYWGRLSKEQNIPAALITWLKTCYGIA